MQEAERENARLRARNETLAREVLDLQSGEAVVEQRARHRRVALDDCQRVGINVLRQQFCEERGARW